MPCPRALAHTSQPIANDLSHSGDAPRRAEARSIDVGDVGDAGDAGDGQPVIAPHDAPSTTSRGDESFAHWILQVDPAPHDSEHEPVQRTVHVDIPAQSTLPLSPTVTSQSEPPLQLMLHELPQAPVHVLSFVHASVQLSPLHPESPISHAAPGSHAHEAPVQVGGGVPPPHAAETTVRDKAVITIKIRLDMTPAYRSREPR